MEHSIWLYIAVMSLVSYLIRVLPVTLIRRQIKNRFLRSVLYYLPYVTLSVMTFPAILRETSTPWSGLAGFVTALLLSYKGKGLIFVSLCSCAVVFLLELVLVA